MKGINKCRVIRRICVVIFAILVLCANCSIVSFGEETQESVGEKSGRMISDRLAEESIASEESGAPVQLDAFMVACLVVVGVSLGMVLLNMKIDGRENVDSPNVDE